MTIRPILSPSARISDVPPSAVGGATTAGAATPRAPKSTFAALSLIFGDLSEIGPEVGRLVASTFPGWSLTSAPSLPVFPVRDTTVFGTGFAAVGFTGITTRGGATAAVFAFAPFATVLAGSPNPALPSVTGMGGRLETSPSVFCLTTGGTGSLLLAKCWSLLLAKCWSL